jgi:hypothetical protein
VVLAGLTSDGMYLVFCWEVYAREGEPKALAKAARIGRFRR